MEYIQRELDFVIEYNGTVLPLEIKSGKNYTVHSAMDNCLRNREFRMNKGIVFANCNVKVEEKITYIPIYMVMFLEKNPESQLTPEPLLF